MKKIIQLVFSALLLVIGLVSVILFAQLFINFKIIDIKGYTGNIKEIYLTVSILMALASATGLVLSIINFLFLKGNMWVGINALGALVIGIIIAALTAMFYDAIKNDNSRNLSKTTLQAVQYLPLLLSSIIFVPSCIGFVLTFAKK